MAYNGYGFNQPYYGYDPNLYYSPYYPNSNYSTISYSATTFSDPKLIEYDPNLGMSQLVISYSNLEFDEPEFEEYDPTPYGGGYDIAQTYGKPLPPSEETCYPHSGKISTGLPSDAIAVGAIVPLPNAEEEIHEKEKEIIPQNGSAGHMTEKMPEPQDDTGDLPEEEEEEKDRSHETQDLIPYENEDSKDNYYSGYGNEYERQVPPQYPSGYGLETLDLCESLFGYWPCLEKMKKRGNCYHDVVNDEGYYNYKDNMWKGTADYLFGSPYPYGGRGDDGSGYGGDTVYAYDYERHYPTQSQYSQSEYHED